MWVTAFDEVAEAILGITVKKFSAFDDDGRKRVAGGVSGMKWYMTIEKTHGVYTNYTVESMEPAGYFYWTVTPKQTYRVVESMRLTRGFDHDRVDEHCSGYALRSPVVINIFVIVRYL